MKQQKELKKTLGLGSLIIYGVGDMLGAGIYGLIGVAAGLLGNSVWLGFAISALVATLTALTYASLGSRYPKAGGAAYVAGRAFGRPILTYVMGLAVMASGLVSMAAASRAFVSYFHSFLPTVPALVLVAFFIALLAFVTFLGMKESSWMNAVCTVIEVGGLLFVIAVGASYWGSVDLLALPQNSSLESTGSVLLLLQGAVLTFYAFIGFEDLLNISEEVKDPAKHFAKGILTAVLITTAVYIAVSITAVSVVPAEVFGTTDKGPLVLVVEKAAPWFDARIFGIIALFAIANTALLNYVMASRLIFGMSRHGALPHVLSILHHSRHTPHIAIVLIFLIVLALASVGDISQLASATSILLLLVFIVMNVSLIKLKLDKSEERGAFEIPYIIPAAAVIINVSLLAARSYAEDRKPIYIAGVLLAVIAVLYFVTPKNHLVNEEDKI